MKRALDYVALCAQRDALDAQCRECIRPLHEAVFALEDVIFEHLVQWIARWFHCAVIVPLGRVSRAWLGMVRRITHANSPSHLTDGWVYEKLLTWHPCLRSIQAHPNILLCDITPGLVAHITSLQLDECNENDAQPAVYDVSQWCALRTLSLPDGLDTYVKGLTGLTALTDLTCSVSAFGDAALVAHDLYQPPETLLTLTQMQRLAIVGFDATLPLGRLPLLRKLHSDSVQHFVGFSGRGTLYTDHLDLVSVNERALAATYDGARYALHCWGEWRDGIFSGDAQVHYGENCFFTGALHENRRHGAGRHWDYAGRDAYEAHWVHGQLHGELLRRDPADQLLQNYCALEHWEHGQLVASWRV